MMKALFQNRFAQISLIITILASSTTWGFKVNLHSDFPFQTYEVIVGLRSTSQMCRVPPIVASPYPKMLLQNSEISARVVVDENGEGTVTFPQLGHYQESHCSFEITSISIIEWYQGMQYEQEYSIRTSPYSEPLSEFSFGVQDNAHTTKHINFEDELDITLR